MGRHESAGRRPIQRLPEQSPSRQARLIAVLFTFFAVSSVGLAAAMVHGITQSRERGAEHPGGVLADGGSARPTAEPTGSASPATSVQPPRSPGTPTVAPSRSATARPGASGTARPTITARPTGTFTAVYETLSTRSTSFRGKLTIVNRGATSGAWQVDLTFPDGVSVTWSSGGSYRQRGSVASFTWDEGLDAGGTLSLEFEANKTAQDLAGFVPRSCSINTDPCS